MVKFLAIELALVVVAILVVAQNFAANAPGITTLVTAVLGGLALLITALAGFKIALAKSVVPILEKVDKIEAHVNSEKTADKGTITALRMQVDLQQQVIKQLEQAAGLLAQAKAIRDAAAGGVAAVVAATGMASAAPVAPSSAPVLKAIEHNTAETSANTKKTDADAGGGA